MEIGILLEELIHLAQTSKTDFAIAVDITPSGLSKILSGKRLPFVKEKRMFSQKAGKYFAENIYEDGCYRKLNNRFPVIYNFGSKFELERFLVYAIEYAIDKDVTAENGEDMDYTNRDAISFLGKKSVLNMFCILVSDYILSNGDAPMEFYSTLPLLMRFHADTFGRLRIFSQKRRKNMKFNHYIRFPNIEDAIGSFEDDVLSTIVKGEWEFDLKLWQITEEIDSVFLLLKGRFLLQFSTQMDGTLLMTLITHKSYLTAFFNTLMKKKARKLSFTKKEAIAGLKENAVFIDKLLGKSMDAVFNFTGAGHFLKKEDLDKIEGDEAMKGAVLKLFRNVLTQKSPYYFTVDSIMNFSVDGKMNLPFLGTIEIPPEERITHLRRLGSYVKEEDFQRIRIVNSEFPNISVFCGKGFCLVYIVNDDFPYEKIHYFETDMLKKVLTRQMADKNMQQLEFSMELWETYIDELLKDVHTTAF